MSDAAVAGGATVTRGPASQVRAGPACPSEEKDARREQLLRAARRKFTLEREFRRAQPRPGRPSRIALKHTKRRRRSLCAAPKGATRGQPDAPKRAELQFLRNGAILRNSRRNPFEPRQAETAVAYSRSVGRRFDSFRAHERSPRKRGLFVSGLATPTWSPWAARSRRNSAPPPRILKP
jgi:hypothetical protein